MPTFRVTAPDGRMVRLTGDSAPSDEELDEIFRGLPPAKMNPNTPSMQAAKEQSTGVLPTIDKAVGVIGDVGTAVTGTGNLANPEGVVGGLLKSLGRQGGNALDLVARMVDMGINPSTIGMGRGSTGSMLPKQGLIDSIVGQEAGAVEPQGFAQQAGATTGDFGVPILAALATGGLSAGGGLLSRVLTQAGAGGAASAVANGELDAGTAVDAGLGGLTGGVLGGGTRVAKAAAQKATPALMGTALKTRGTDFLRKGSDELIDPVDTLVRHGITGQGPEMLAQVKIKLSDLGAAKKKIVESTDLGDRVVSGKNALTELKDEIDYAGKKGLSGSVSALKEARRVIRESFKTVGEGTSGKLLDASGNQIAAKGAKKITEFDGLAKAVGTVEKLDSLIREAADGRVRVAILRARSAINTDIRRAVPRLAELNDDIYDLANAKKLAKRSAGDSKVKRVPGTASGNLLDRIVRQSVQKTVGNPATASKVAQYGGRAPKP